MKEIKEPGDTEMLQKKSLILFLLKKKNISDFSTLVRIQRRRGCNTFSSPFLTRPM